MFLPHFLVLISHSPDSSQEEGSLGAESAALPVPQGRWWQVSQGGLASGVRGGECLETHYQARESAQLPE